MHITWKNFLYYLGKSLFDLAANVENFLINFVVKLIVFLGPVFNSVYGKINEEELYRVVTLSVSVGGGFFGAVHYIADNASAYISDKMTLAFVRSLSKTLEEHSSLAIIVVLVFILDFYRRKFHGWGATPNKEGSKENFK